MANVLGDSATIPTWTQFGLSTHPIVVFGITLFFIICSPSYLSGQFMSLFSGTLLIGLSYYVARQAFGELPGIVAGILVALQPWLIFWSVVLYGPEILGSLLLMTLLTLLSLQTLAGTLTTRAAAFDAIIATLLLGAEYPAFLSMFIVLPFFLSKSFPYGRRLLIVATTYVLVLLSSPLAYFASRPDFFILTPLPLVYPILVVTMLGSLFFVLRYTRQWVKPLVVMFFSLNLGFQALLARADLAKLTIPSTQLFTTLPAPLAGTLPSYQVLARVEDIVLLQLSFWHLTRASVGDLSLILGFFAVLYGRQLNQRLSYFLILVSGSLFYTLGPVSSDLLSPNWWNFRLALPFMPVILILLSSLFRNESTSRRLPKWRVIQPRKLLAIGLVVLTIVASIPAYWQVSTSLRIFDHQALWGPVAAWASSTKPNSIFLVFDPDLWNWMSSRTSVALRVYSNSVPSYDPQSYDLGTIITLIREYHAKYVILDSSTVPTSQVVSKYFATPNTSPYGFSLNFTNTVGGITVWVYDVTTFENLTGQIATVTLNLEDNAQVYAEWPNSTYAHWAGATWWDSTVLLVGWSSGLNESRVFLKFNSSSIPTNARILNERLIIPIGFTYSSSQTATPLVIEARPTSSDWNDQQLTWLNQPHLIDSSSSKAETSYPFRGPVYLSVRPQNQTSSGISVALVPNGSTTIWRYASIYSIAGALRNEGMGVPTSLPMMEILYSY